MRKYIFAITFFISCVSFVTGLLIGSIDYEATTEQTKTFKVECKSFDFYGEVYRKDNKFYELINSKEIWLPLNDCLLLEI